MDAISNLSHGALGLCLAAALTMASSTASAEPAAGQGVGTYTCGEAAQGVRRDRQLDLIYFSWAQGWMTGWNLAQMNANQPTADLNARPLADQRDFIKVYCALHPEGLYMDAVRQLYLSIMSDRK
jgi:hypothetical protein